MQIVFNPTKLFVSNQNLQIAQKQQSNPVQENKNSIGLSNFNSVGRSLVSFKGDSSSKIDLKSKSIEELEDLRKVMTDKRDEIEAKKKEAQEKLDAIAAWNYSDEYLKQKNAAESEINEKDLSRFWNPFQCSNIRQKHYNSFIRENAKIESYKVHQQQYKDIVSLAPLSDGEAQNFIASIDAMIEQKEQIEKNKIWQEGIDGVNEAYETMKNAKGGFKDRIAGYEYAVDELRRLFVEPLAQSQNNKNIAVPACIMLHGARGTGKTEMIKAIAAEADAGGFAKVVEINTTGLPLDEFKVSLKREMEKARTRYIKERKRTVILVNEIQKYLGFTTEDELKKEYPDLIDEKDIKSINDYATDASFINDIKDLLDNCSNIPEDIMDKSGACATTLFFTTNYPHLIDRDILRKIDHYIAINPAKNEDLSAVVKHYAQRSSVFVNKIKTLFSNPDFKPENIKRLHLGLSKEAIENLQRMVEENRINELNIDVEKMDFSLIPKDFNPSMKKGAYNNKQLRQAALDALNHYLQDPTSEYESYLWQALFNMPRDITPASHKKFVAIYNELAPLCEKEGDDIISKNEEEMLRIMHKAGKLTGKFKAKWEYIQKRNLAEMKKLETLEQQNKLSEEQKQRLYELKNPEIDSGETDEEWQ